MPRLIIMSGSDVIREIKRISVRFVAFVTLETFVLMDCANVILQRVGNLKNFVTFRAFKSTTAVFIPQMFLDVDVKFSTLLALGEILTPT